MAINFPNSPQAGDPHSEAGIDWVYDGEKWVAQSEATFWARTNSTLSPSTAGDNISTTGDLSVAAGTFSGDLTAGCTTTGTSGSSGEAKVVGYQQGLWTPATVTGTAGAVRPYWSRIGNTVFVTALINTFSDRTSNVTVNIEGLPYAVISGYNNVAGPLMGQYLTDGAVGGWSTYLNSASELLFYRTTASGWISLKHSALNNSASSLHLCATYLTDDTTWAPANGATIS